MYGCLTPLVVEMSSRGILYREAVQEFKKRFLSAALRKNDNNRSRAARRLGMHRNTMHGLIRQLKIDSRPARRAQKRRQRERRNVAKK